MHLILCQLNATFVIKQPFFQILLNSICTAHMRKNTFITVC